MPICVAIELIPMSVFRLYSKLMYRLCCVACAEEVKGIEFTVTTLNCTQDQNNAAPGQRRKFSSLRKTGALSKAVRSKISKSFYSNSSSNKTEQKTASVQASTTATSATNTLDKANDVQASGKCSGKDKSAMKTESAINLATAPTNKTDKSEKHKKRSKLCQLL